MRRSSEKFHVEENKTKELQKRGSELFEVNGNRTETAVLAVSESSSRFALPRPSQRGSWGCCTDQVVSTRNHLVLVVPSCPNSASSISQPATRGTWHSPGRRTRICLWAGEDLVPSEMGGRFVRGVHGKRTS